MKILLLASYAGSLRNFRGPLIMAMLAAGHEVHAAAPVISEDAATRAWLKSVGAVWHDIRLSRTGISPVEDLRSLRQLVSLMRQIGPDVFLGYTIKPVVWGLIAARIAGVRKRAAMITGLGYAFTGKASGKRALLQRIARGLYSFALRGADAIFFQNPDDRDDFRRMGLLPRKTRIEITAGSGIDLAQFQNVPLPSGPTRFLMIARLLGDKGTREYAAAAALVKAQAPDVEFHLVGGLDSNPDAIAKSEVEGWVDSGALVWHGALSDVRPSLAECHVYVLPSYREGTPRTVLEAMATGRAVITTDAPGCRETVRDGENGVLVPVAQVQPLVDAMIDLIRNPDKISAMGTNARTIAENRYDVHKVNGHIMSVLGL